MNRNEGLSANQPVAPGLKTQEDSLTSKIKVEGNVGSRREVEFKGPGFLIGF